MDAIFAVRCDAIGIRKDSSKDVCCRQKLNRCRKPLPSRKTGSRQLPRTAHPTDRRHARVPARSTPNQARLRTLTAVISNQATHWPLMRHLSRHTRRRAHGCTFSLVQHNTINVALWLWSITATRRMTAERLRHQRPKDAGSHEMAIRLRYLRCLRVSTTSIPQQ